MYLIWFMLIVFIVCSLELQSNAASSQQTTSGRKQPTNAERKNPLLSDAAQSVLAMGYLPRIVKMAVDKVLQSKGNVWVERLQNKLSRDFMIRLKVHWPSKIRDMINMTSFFFLIQFPVLRNFMNFSCKVW